MNNHPGRTVTVFQISQIFSEAYLKAALPLNAINGFKKCDIFPIDPDVFTDTDFVAVETTDQPEMNSQLVDEQQDGPPIRLSPVPSTSKEAELESSFGSIGSSNIVPVPHMTGTRCMRKRASGGTMILTSSPYKNQLEEDKKRKLLL